MLLSLEMGQSVPLLTPCLSNSMNGFQCVGHLPGDPNLGPVFYSCQLEVHTFFWV